MDVLRLDLGCGTHKCVAQDGSVFTGIDCIQFDGVDHVTDLSVAPWVFTGECPEWGVLCTEGTPENGWVIKDAIVDEVFSSHFVEHLTGDQRILFFNELYRVLKKDAKALVITPDWSHACAYGDPTHKWPPMSSWYCLYLNKEWRDANAPHVPYTCDFGWMYGAGWDEWLSVRNDEFKQFAMQRYINSTRDLHVTLTKK